jgi:type I restriction enzyme S subunit
MAPSGTQPNLNIGIMKNFKIILPPMKDQKRFIDVLEKFNSINEKMKNALKDSEILFDAVQQKFIGN